MALLDLIPSIAGLANARSAGGSLIVGGIDLLAGLASQSILSFSYSDNTSDKADDLSIEIADPMRTWMQTYLPKKGVECTAQIRVQNWRMPGDTRLVECGVFWLDQIDFRGPPNTVSVKAVSIPVTSGMKNQKKFRSWEGQDLMAIASQIATENGLALVWDTKENPKTKRVDQVDCADLEFIRDRVKECSLSLKIYNRQLIIYSEAEYEERPPVYLITYGMSNILSWNFSSKLDDTYAKAKNAYVNPETGKLIETEFETIEKPEGTGSELMINERVEEDEDEATGAEVEPLVELSDFIDFTNTSPGANAGRGSGASEASTRKTKAKLREKNKKEKECTLTLFGNPDYLSGLNAQLLGFGIFDGKWHISSSVHDISENGYTTQLRLRKTLSGY